MSFILVLESRLSYWPSSYFVKAAMTHYYFKFPDCPVFGGSPARTASLSSTTRLNMKRIYLEGEGVRGPSFPSRCRILVARTVCSQSSINSHRWARPVSLLSGFSSMMPMMQSTIARLYSKPPWKKQTIYEDEFSESTGNMTERQDAPSIDWKK